jgi:hypothetical protein
MRAMDAELSRLKGGAGAQPKTAVTLEKPITSSDAKGKAKAEPADDDESTEEMDLETAMDVELRNALLRDLNGEDDGSDLDFQEGEGMDYTLIKNFLESFKSQAGLPGPVGNLAGRLQPGWTLPRDDS